VHEEELSIEAIPIEFKNTRFIEIAGDSPPQVIFHEGLLPELSHQAGSRVREDPV